MKGKWLWGLPVLWFLISNCTKEPLDNLTNEESRIYITNYDSTAQFSNYATFSIADSVAVISNNQLRGRERSDIDIQFINAVASALQQRGYTKVAHSQNPDLGITVSRITNTTTQLVSYTDYGGYYGGYWDPFYWGYPGYDYYFPTYYGTYQTRETALTVDAFDLKDATQSNTLRNVWSGLIRGSGIFSSNPNDQIMALFNQSAYFKR